MVWEHVALTAEVLLAEEEVARRKAAGIPPVTDLTVLTLLSAMPQGEPVWVNATSRSRLARLPAGVVELSDSWAVRLLQPPLECLHARVPGRWRRGLAQATQLAPFSERSLVLEAWPPRTAPVVVAAECALWGVGLVDPDGEVVSEAAPFRPKLFSPFRWLFAERLLAASGGR